MVPSEGDGLPHFDIYIFVARLLELASGAYTKSWELQVSVSSYSKRSARNVSKRAGVLRQRVRGGEGEGGGIVSRLICFSW